MKKSDTEQEQPGLEENKVPDSQSKRELDRELQELAEKEHQEEIYYEERRRERHERNLKRKKRQIRNRNLALIITALLILCGLGYFAGFPNCLCSCRGPPAPWRADRVKRRHGNAGSQGKGFGP